MLKMINPRRLLLLLGVVLLGYGIAYLKGMEASTQLTVQGVEIGRLTTELSASNTALARAEVELQTDQVMLADVTAQQRLLISENANLKKQLVFYQRIMAPETVINGVQLESLSFTPEVSTDYYYMQLVLMQVQKQKRHIKANAELIFYGSIEGEPVVFSFNELSDASQPKLDFSFRYFQSIEASIKLPSGFVPERVAFVGSIKGNRWNRGIDLKRSFNWAEVVSVNDASDEGFDDLVDSNSQLQINPVDIDNASTSAVNTISKS